jgi:hypothetical protein
MVSPVGADGKTAGVIVFQEVLGIFVGMRRSTNVPSPTDPNWLDPQHHREFDVVAPHVRLPPELIAFQFAPAIWVGESRSLLELSPSCPVPLYPQHHKELFVLVAQV